MMMPRYRLDSDLLEADREFIDDQLRQFNHVTAPPVQEPLRRLINLAVRDENNVIRGGVLGYMYRYCLFIDTLWVDETLRGQGYGKALMTSAEDMARQWGATLSHLDTFSFQAPDFYRHCGYQIFGVLEGYADGITRYYLKKSL